MAERMDILSARSYTDKNGEARTAFSRIGTAWQTSKGWALTFEALPLPSMNDKGVVETRVLMMPPREPQQRGPAQASDGGGAGAAADDIPFAPEWRG